LTTENAFWGAETRPCEARSNPGRSEVHSYLPHGDDAIPLKHPIGLHLTAMEEEGRTGDAASRTTRFRQFWSETPPSGTSYFVGVSVVNRNSHNNHSNHIVYVRSSAI